MNELTYHLGDDLYACLSRAAHYSQWHLDLT